MEKILIIGAQNIDIFSHSKDDFVLEDSNPAKISIGFGGVGRNIAVNLSRLDFQVHFISVFGDDAFSQSAQNNLKQLNIDISHSLFQKNSSNSLFLGIMNKENDLHLGFHDMDIIDDLNPDYLSHQSNYIQQFDYLVIDNNLSLETISYLLNQYNGKNIFIDAVSAHKAKKLENLLTKIKVLKVNKQELEVLSQKKSIEEGLNKLHAIGAECVLLTQKEGEVILSKKEVRVGLKPKAIDKVLNVSGAGDAFLSGYIYGEIENYSDEHKLKVANIAARICLGSHESTSSELSKQEIEKYAAIQ